MVIFSGVHAGVGYTLHTKLVESQWSAARVELDLPSLKNKHLILMGPPGAGKGSLSQFLQADGNYYSFSLGEAIRQEIANETAIGMACKEDLAAGNLVPTAIGFALFDQHFQGAIQNNQLFIIDGMIQSQTYVDFFDLYIAEHGLNDQFAFIYLKLDENIARQRIVDRGREDDRNEKTVTKRLDRFYTSAILLIDNYRNRKNYIEIDAGQDLEVLQEMYTSLFK